MELSEYPLVIVYLEEMEMLKERSPLGTVLICGTLSELILREIMNDEKRPIGKLLDRALHSNKIDENQFRLFDDIRNIRNKYIHISSDKVSYNLHDGLVFVDTNNIAQFVNEIAFNNPTEENLIAVHKIHLVEDSRLIYESVKKLIESLSKTPQNPKTA